MKSATMTAHAACLMAQGCLVPHSLGGQLKPLAAGGGRNNQAAWHYPTLPPPPVMPEAFLSSRANTQTWNLFQTPFV